MHKYTLILFLAFISLHGWAQQEFNYTWVDKETYAFYQQKAWKQLIKTGKASFRKSIDYYYLRMRVGIGYFELNRYRLADKHFSRALKFNDADEVAREYKFYSLLNSGRYEDAMFLSRMFSSGLRSKLDKYLSPVFYAPFAEIGSKAVNTSEVIANAGYFQTGISNRFGRSVFLTHLLNYYSQNTPVGAIRQWQWYTQAKVPLSTSFSISPAIHFLKNNVQVFTPFGSEVVATEGNILGSLTLKKSLPRFDVSASVSSSNFSNTRQIQGTATLHYYPTGDHRLAFTTAGYWQKEGGANHSGYGLGAFAQIRPKLSATLSYYSGDLRNFSMQNGAYVNNNINLTTSMVTLMPELMVSKKTSLFFTLQREHKVDWVSQSPFHYTTMSIGLKLKTF